MATAVYTRLVRIGWQIGEGLAECAATQREQRIGESVALALKWTWLASPTAATNVNKRHRVAMNRLPRLNCSLCDAGSTAENSFMHFTPASGVATNTQVHEPLVCYSCEYRIPPAQADTQ